MRKLLLLMFIGFGYILSGQELTIDENFIPQLLNGGRGNNVFALADGRLIVSGTFSHVGDDFSGKRLVRLTANGLLDTSFDYPFINAPVCIAAQKDGKILIGGNFRDEDDRFAGNLFRLEEDGSIDTDFAYAKDSSLTVEQMVVLPQQKIFIVASQREPGVSTTFSIQLRGINGDADSQFEEPVLGSILTGNNYVTDIGFQSDNELLIAGTELEIDGSVQDMFRIDTLGQIDTDFHPEINSVSNLVVKNFDVLPNGIIGVLATDEVNITLLNRDGSTLGLHQVDNSRAMIVANGEDNFAVVGNNIATIALNSAVISYNQGVDNWLYGITRQPGGGIVGVGSFRNVAGFFTPGIVRMYLSPTSFFLNIDQNFSKGLLMPGTISEIIPQADGSVLVGGNFNFVNGFRQNHITRLLPDGSTDFNFNIAIAADNHPVFEIEPATFNRYIIGSEYGGVNFSNFLNGLSFLSNNGYTLQNLNFPYFTLSGNIFQLEVDSEGNIYAGESVGYVVGNNAGQRLVKYNSQGQILENYDEVFIDTIFRFNKLIVQPDDRLLIFGKAIGYDGAEISSAVRAEPDGQLDMSFSSEIPTEYLVVEAILFEDGSMLASGVKPDGEAALFKLHANGSLDEGFISIASWGIDNTTKLVTFMAKLTDGRILVHGQYYLDYPFLPQKFSAFIDQEGNYLGNFLLEDSDPAVSALAEIGLDSFYVGGNFATAQDARALIRLIPGIPDNTHEVPMPDQLKINLYPNPVQDQLNLGIPQAYIGQSVLYQIIDASSGRNLKSGKFVAKEHHEISTASLAKGIYFIKLVSGEFAATKKIIKQ